MVKLARQEECAYSPTSDISNYPFRPFVYSSAVFWRFQVLGKTTVCQRLTRRVLIKRFPHGKEVVMLARQEECDYSPTSDISN